MSGKIRRNRPIKSCYFCYSRKQQCNKVRPKCNQCVKYHRDKCTYGFNKDLEDPFESLAPRQSNESEKFIPNAFYPYFDDLSNMNYLVESRGSHRNANTYSFSFIDISYNYKPNWSQILQSIPRKQTCNRWVAKYFSRIHPIIPILDYDTTKNNINTLLANLKGDNIDLNSLLTLFGILFAVAISLEVEQGFKKDEGTSIDSTLKFKYFGAVEYLKLRLGFPSDPTITCIEASLIVYTCGSTNYKDLSAYISTLVRCSEILGLHRDPLKLGTGARESRIDPERRKKLWHYVMYADAMSSVYYGLASLAAKVDYDTGFPLYIVDGALDSSLAFAVARFKCSLVISNLIDILNGTNKPDKVMLISLYQKVLALYDDCYRIIQDLETHVNDNTYCVWLTANISVFVHRAYLIWERIHHSLSKTQTNMKIVATETMKQDQPQDMELQNLLNLESVDNLGLKVAVLLLYATAERITIGPHNENYLWFIRHCQPFQYLLILLRDINISPHKSFTINDQDLPRQIANYIPQHLKSETATEHRLNVTELVFEKLERIREFWPDPVKARFQLIKNLKDHVFQKLDNQIQGDPPSVNFEFDFEEIFRGHNDILNMQNFILDGDFYNVNW